MAVYRSLLISQTELEWSPIKSLQSDAIKGNLIFLPPPLAGRGFCPSIYQSEIILISVISKESVAECL